MRSALFILFSFCYVAGAQMPAFRSLTTAKGLNDGTIRCFGQDKYGYIWIGTESGLNRFNGYAVKQYLNVPGDTTSMYPGHLWGMGLGPDGAMYFGSPYGLARYNYHTDNFTRIGADRPFMAGQMVVLGSDSLLHASSVGLLYHNTSTGKLHFFSDDIKDPAQLALAKRALGDIALLKNKKVVATSRIGLLVFDLDKRGIQLVTVPGLSSQAFSNVEVTKNGTVWLSCANQPILVKTDTTFSRFRVYDYLFPNRSVLPNAISSLLVDKQDQLWVTTGPDGLCLYQPQTNSFTSYKSDPSLPASLHANYLTAIFQDRQGLIWLGTTGYGVNYFQPDKKQFQILLPRGTGHDSDGWLWARAASEDTNGNLWLATVSGVIQYNEKSGVVRNFRNEEKKDRQLYYNSVRGILCEGDLVWFITGGGINRYHRLTGRMEFLTEKDSLPPAFYFTACKDSRGTLWIGGRDYDGLYYREAGKSFRGIRHHPVLHKLMDIYGYGVRCIFEDSKHRLWFGLNSGGLALYDVQKQILKHWQWKEGDSTSLTGNLVTGIAEDKNGTIWLSTTSGIAAYQEANNRFVQYTQKNGLPSVRTSCIQVDGANRVWAGSTHGLLMLDAGRKTWTLFDEDDGLTGAEFADMPSQKLSDGRFIFPTLKGFLLFNPMAYNDRAQQLKTFVTGFRVFNQPAVTEVNPEEIQSMHFAHDQNFFSLELTALNYENPAKTWYAYKLDGFDKEWIYTRQRTVNYTNVPGGAYTFFYKASADSANWNVPGQTLLISVGTVYYKTPFFWMLLVFLVAFTLYGLYRFRMNKQRQILQLETRAKELEKEKTVVQYESLKQHLNPHFLFNSLTSLRSLIRTDTKTATSFLDGMSKVYRYVLKSGDKELILLKDELDFVQTFVLLQKTRFGEGLQVNICVAEAFYGKYIVPVTLQNLVENASKHNMADSENPLHIQVTATEDYLVVQNNLQRYQQVESSNGKGLTGLKNLYRFYTDKPVVIQEDEQTFTIKIPLL